MMNGLVMLTGVSNALQGGPAPYPGLRPGQPTVGLVHKPGGV